MFWGQEWRSIISFLRCFGIKRCYLHGFGMASTTTTGYVGNTYYQSHDSARFQSFACISLRPCSFPESWQHVGCCRLYNAVEGPICSMSFLLSVFFWCWELIVNLILSFLVCHMVRSLSLLLHRCLVSI
ncbi:hypothetical protein EDC01DRAFT_668797 [Geopyxis carbonaria]|nr:hypothetical protein EDC01DRAFT_668797 [Geopyxis carbonaria]